MKLCYIAPYKDGTGYSNQSVHNMLALEAGGVDVVARAVNLSQSKNHELAKKVEHLENKNTDNVDVVIQHVLPHLFEYKHGVRNIGMFCFETTHFRRSNWDYCCNMMSEIQVPSLQNAKAAIDSGVTIPIKIFPCACNIERFNNPPKPLDTPQLKNKCVFYTIGELTRRKNVVAIIRAFYSAFSLRDDVALVIKTSIPGKSPDETINILRTTIEDMRKSMHIYMKHSYYPPITCITDFLSDKKIDQLHMACDAFVSASHGEAIGLPAFDALGFGNPAILSNWGYYPELTYAQASKYWEPENHRFKHPGEIDCGWLINGQLTPCFGMVDSFPDLYTGEESWFDPDICHLTECMKNAYHEWQNGKLYIKGEAAKKRISEFSYDKVGKIARKLLEI